MAWIFLILAGLGEVLWATSLEYKRYFFYILSMCGTIYFTILASKMLPISTVYPILIGIGTAGVLLVSILIFGETITWLKFIFILFILIGIVGIKMR